MLSVQEERISAPRTASRGSSTARTSMLRRRDISCAKASRCAGVGLKTLHSRTSRRSEEHTSELQSLTNLVCRLLLEKKNEPRVTRFAAVVCSECNGQVNISAFKQESYIVRHLWFVDSIH